MQDLIPSKPFVCSASIATAVNSEIRNKRRSYVCRGDVTARFKRCIIGQQTTSLPFDNDVHYSNTDNSRRKHVTRPWGKQTQTSLPTDRNGKTPVTKRPKFR